MPRHRSIGEKDETDDESYARIQQRYEETLPVATEILLNADSLRPANVVPLSGRHAGEISIPRGYRSLQARYANGSGFVLSRQRGNFIVIVLSGNQYGMDIQHRIGWLLLGLILVSSVLIHFVGRLYATRMVDRIDAVYQK